MSYQKIVIVGNLGQEPELRYMPDGTAVANLSVATNRRWTNRDGTPGEETVWFRVAVWRRQAETAAEYLTKGRQVMVEGRLTPDKATGGPRIWTGNDGQPRASFEITADRVIFLGGRGSGGGEQAAEEPETAVEPTSEPF
jgi:single-strand DNA-binding protein